MICWCLLNYSLNVSGLRLEWSLAADTHMNRHKCTYQDLHCGLFFRAFLEVLQKKNIIHLIWLSFSLYKFHILRVSSQSNHPTAGWGRATEKYCIWTKKTLQNLKVHIVFWLHLYISWSEKREHAQRCASSCRPPSHFLISFLLSAQMLQFLICLSGPIFLFANSLNPPKLSWRSKVITCFVRFYM